MTHRTVIAGVAALSLGGVALATPPTALAATYQGPDSLGEAPRPPKIKTPWLLSADPTPRGLNVSGGFSYAQLNGRKFELTDGLAQYSPGSPLSFFYDRQHYFVKGRTAGRVNLNNNVFGLRLGLNIPKPDERMTNYAIQFEYTAPDDMDETDSSGTGYYKATRGYHTTLMATDIRANTYAFTYSFVKGNSDAYGHGYFASYGHELAHKGPASLDLQVAAGFQDIKYVYNTLEFRTMIQGVAHVDIVPGLNLELAATYAPSGLPLTSGALNGISSFMVYRPSGAADDVVSHAMGLVSARLDYQIRF